MKRFLSAIGLTALLAAQATAREVNNFAVSDGFATYSFALKNTSRKLFYYTYQAPGDDNAERVFEYAPIGPAPLDSAVVRGAIASEARWLFWNDRVRLDEMNPINFPLGIICYRILLTADGSEAGGVGLRFRVIDGAIRSVEVASSSRCSLQRALMNEVEAGRPRKKGRGG